jgi:hypothetical protein
MEAACITQYWNTLRETTCDERVLRVSKGYSDREWSYKRFVYLEHGGDAQVSSFIQDLKTRAVRDMNGYLGLCVK